MSDPFAEIIGLLRPRTTLWRGIVARGRWAVSFRSHDDVLFCSLASGSCLLLQPGEEPRLLNAGDIVLIHTTKPFRLASDRTARSVDSEQAFAIGQSRTFRIGTGRGDPVEIHGGRVLFDASHESLLTGLLPPIMHVRGTDASAPRIHTLLAMNAEESRQKRPGRSFVVPRLMELLLVEILRAQSASLPQTGLLAGLQDEAIAEVLIGIHGDVARDWTVVTMAKRAGMSRSLFAERFAQRVGLPPMRYLARWRMAIARDALLHGKQSLTEIAFAVGFQSLSAFSTAFRREEGCSPRRFLALHAQPKQ